MDWYTILLFFICGIGTFLNERDIAFLLFFEDAIKTGSLPIISNTPPPPIITPVAASSKEDSFRSPIKNPAPTSAAPPISIILAPLRCRLLLAEKYSRFLTISWEKTENASNNKSIVLKCKFFSGLSGESITGFSYSEYDK